jgi:hypothetical protein
MVAELTLLKMVNAMKTKINKPDHSFLPVLKSLDQFQITKVRRGIKISPETTLIRVTAKLS